VRQIDRKREEIGQSIRESDHGVSRGSETELSVLHETLAKRERKRIRGGGKEEGIKWKTDCCLIISNERVEAWLPFLAIAASRAMTTANPGTP
jgi:hypothetical protein